MQQDCDFSPLKQKLAKDLTELIEQLQHITQSLDNEEYCILKEFAPIRIQFAQIESLASSFYLQCYLSPYTDHYLELTASVQHLSKRRHGALIAVQRTDSLEPLIKPGTPIRANLSRSLLESIFYPGSPLHDGAVLIKGNQILSAGNLFPLSNQGKTPDGNLGTRHRAALGLSEQCDAVVIVVSEETGRASFAINGNLHPLHIGPLPFLYKNVDPQTPGSSAE